MMTQNAGTETKPAVQDDPSTAPTVAIGIVGAVLLLLMVIVLETLFHAAQKQEDFRKLVAPPVEELSRLRAGQQERLNMYRWVDPSKGLVAIPIERAMELEAQSLNAAREQGPSAPRAASPGAREQGPNALREAR